MIRSKQSRPLDVGAALLHAYAANARVNQYLVERLHPSVWRAKPPAPRMRTVAALVAHVHNCGLVYLKRAAPNVAVPGEMDRFRVTPAQAARALKQGERIGPHDAATFLAYYMVHDGHHRGQILLQARLLGHPVSTETMSGMWQWPARARE